MLSENMTRDSSNFMLKRASLCYSARSNIVKSHCCQDFIEKMLYLLYYLDRIYFILFPVDWAGSTVSVTTQLCHRGREMNQGGLGLNRENPHPGAGKSIWSGNLLVD